MGGRAGESGAKYVYLQGQPHPVLNRASARLIIGRAVPPTRTMSAASLRDVPRGRPVGIASAPDALPDKGSLVGLPWSVCIAPRSPSPYPPSTYAYPYPLMEETPAEDPHNR